MPDRPDTATLSPSSLRFHARRPAQCARHQPGGRQVGQQGNNLSIRGLNSQNDFYLDGMRDFGGYYRDPFNPEAEQVLKGAASVLFGCGASSGTINHVSNQPQPQSIASGAFAFRTDGTVQPTSGVNRQITGEQAWPLYASS